MKKSFFLIPLLIIIFSGCSDNSYKEKIFSSVLELQKKYAPDRHVAVFAVKTYEQGSTLIVTGEVDRPEAKEELLKVLSTERKNIVDSVIVLPDVQLGEKKWGIITVSVANMREERGEDAELGSQVLMGTIVRILKKKGGWVYIQSPDRYLGWADTDQMIRVTESEAQEWNNAKKVFVTSYFGFVHQAASEQSYPVCDITAGVVLQRLGSSGDWTKVGLPDSRTGYVRSSSVMNQEWWGTKLTPVADNIEKTGKFLMGVPYLWGGTSAKGVDCSGFTKTVFNLNGVQLDRNASHQAAQGEPIEPGADFEHLKKGDLLFFGRKAGEGKQERIVHVGIYLGNREYIHSSGKVRLNSLDPSSPIFDESNLKRFVRARRIIASVPQAAEVKLQ